MQEKRQNIFLTTGIIASALIFMLVSGYFIVNSTDNSNSREIAIDARIDKCYEEKGLD